MRNLDSFEVFRAIKNYIRLFANSRFEGYVDLYNFNHIFTIDGYDFVICFDYHSGYCRIINLSIFDFDRNSINVDNEDYLKGLILGCPFDTYE